ncbi:MAG: hypothetical protein ACI392_00065 [Paludibacteraceae bacterium]
MNYLVKPSCIDNVTATNFVEKLDTLYKSGKIRISASEIFDFVGFSEQYGLNATNWGNFTICLQFMHHKNSSWKYNAGRGVVLKYATPDEFAKNINIVTDDFTDFGIIREYMEQRIKPSERRKFLDRCLAELNYYAATHNNHNKQHIELQKQIIESLKQIVCYTLPTTATQAQLPNAKEQTPQITLTDGNKYAIKEIVQKFNNDDAFKGRFDEQQIINCVEKADFTPVYKVGQKKWVRGLICAIKSELPNIDANIFTQIANKLGYTNISELQKSVKQPFGYQITKNQ